MKFTADFETTTNPKDCRVWATGICSIENKDGIESYHYNYGNSIEHLFEHFHQFPNSTYYFHNLKFDGSFLLNYLFNNGYKWVSERKLLRTKTFCTLISDKGQWYQIQIQISKSNRITILDSLKILNFSVAEIANAFNLPISKLEIDYDEYREPGHKLTSQEVNYLRGDVEIMARSLNYMFSHKMNHMTAGSNALHYYKDITPYFKKWFPVMDIKYDKDIRQAYKGAWTYLNPKFKNRNLSKGIVLDVNSLYPWVMRTKLLPYGEGKFFKGEYKPDKHYPLYIQMIRVCFEIKENKLPTIQLKNNLAFVPTEYLTSTNGEEVTICLSSIDIQLLKEHYDIISIEYLSGWKWRGAHGMFDDYIDYWMDKKIEAEKTGNKALRTLAKLMMNSLYGKFALNPIVRSKRPYMEDGILKFENCEKEEREPIYIPMGIFITAYAREKTIRSAQSVYHRFIYADTDSLHLTGLSIPKNLDIDPVRLGAWKLESKFRGARYIRSKSYIEKIKGKMHITCAGMPKTCYPNVTWDNFKPGTFYANKLQQKQVKGGCVLEDIGFTLKL